MLRPFLQRCFAVFFLTTLFLFQIAQPVLAIPAEITANLPETVLQVRETIRIQILRGAITALMSAAEIFMGQIAYDAANAIATAGTGQTPVFFKKSFGDYLSDVAADAGGEFIASISNESFFRNARFDLCRPTNPMLLLRSQMALLNNRIMEHLPNIPGLPNFGFSRTDRPQSRCNFQDVISNYSDVYQQLTSQEVMMSLGKSLADNELAFLASVQNRYESQLSKRLDDAAKSRGEGAGFKGIVNKLSGKIGTPSSVVSQTANQYLVRHPYDSVSKKAGALLSNAATVGGVQLLIYTGSMFVNTLATKMMERIFTKGIDPSDFFGRSINLVSSPDSFEDMSREDVRKANIELRNPPAQRTADFEVVSEMIACPKETRGLWNCTMDQAFAQAIESGGEEGAITVREAIEKNYLHGDWKLLPNTLHRENQDPFCYTYAYCAGNLRKMRLMRILPVGFELAANAPENIDRCTSSNGCVTLREVVENFQSCKNGARDSSKPWCHLIDPNWVVANLPQQCAMSGYGVALASERVGIRQEECQDVQTCLRRNNRGECVGGYGYCLSEKTAYRFDANECEERHASCRSYTNRSDQNVSYLRNTIEYDQCTSENVGCLWFATQRDPTGGATDEWVGSVDNGYRMYFDKTLETCPSSEEGCTRLSVGRVGEAALNLMINPSFERLTDGAPRALYGWQPDDLEFVPVTGLQGSMAAHGNQALDLQRSDLYFQNIAMEPKRNFSLSVYARAIDPWRPAEFTIEVFQFQKQDFTNPVPAASLSRLYRSADCRLIGSAVSLSVTGGLSTEWKRVECSFLVSDVTRGAKVQLRTTTGNVLLDAIQLEESEVPTQFVDGVNTQLQTVHMKIAPDEFACKGDDNDHPGCQKFAKMCRQSEAECQGYMDLQGGAEIPAIVSSQDRCPAACVGYSEYRKAATSFDLVKDADVRFSDLEEPLASHFIASSAALCKQEEVGCEAFTNVSTSGNESRAYFTYLRSCEKPSTESQTYFTWEGSEDTGYQLRTWSLIREVPAAGTTVDMARGPKVILKAGPDAVYKESSFCNESSWRARLDPDCRQFYDPSGNVYYAYYTQTVLSTDACESFRIDRTNRADCTKTGGRFDEVKSECIYQALASDSRTCREFAVGCRAYQGTGAGNVMTVLTENFQSGNGTFGGGKPSTEALLVGDSSLRVDSIRSDRAGINEFFIETSTTIQSTDTDLYRVSFWAKASPSGLPVTLTTADPRNLRQTTVVSNVTIGGDWQRYTVGPFKGQANAAYTVVTWFSQRPTIFFLFLDEVEIQRLRDMAYVRMNTWETPAECNRTAEGVEEPQAMLNCRAYRNRKGEQVTVRQFTRLCRQSAIGCTAFVDSRNSEEVGAESFEKRDLVPIPIAGTIGETYGSAVTVREADRFLYLIDDPSKRCRSEYASCRAFGKPKLSPDRQSLDTNAPFSTIYVKDDITQYGQALCRPSEIFCESFTAGLATEHFRDPQNHVCEYRENVHLAAGAAENLPAGEYNGWFQPGSDRPCYANQLDAGKMFRLLRIGDPGYAGWAGLCPASSAECTEFRDSYDTSDPLHRSGKPYFFLKNENFDTRSCAGTIDPGKGCVLVRDMSDALLKYSIAASYAKYSANKSKATAPIDCSRRSNDPLCAENGMCEGTETVTAPSSLLVSYPIENRTCSTEEDCNRTWTNSSTRGTTTLQGQCVGLPANDANLIVKVKLDRDCTQWMGCTSSETVFDQATNKYRDVCTNLALCDKATGKPGDIFCSHYVNRSSTSSEPILVQGAILDADLYASRKTRFTDRDYSGYATPMQFLPLDLAQRRVAVEGAGALDKTYSSAYAEEYRLVARAVIQRTRGPLGCVYPEPKSENEAKKLCNRVDDSSHGCSTVSPLAASYPELNLCQHMGTSRIGYFLQNEDQDTSCKPLTCYLSVRADNDAFDFTKISQSFGVSAKIQRVGKKAKDLFLVDAFPAPECRVYPEQDSPYPASYVSSWNFSKNPPKRETVTAGFTNAKTCEFGEDCECTYKRAEFKEAAESKFYNVFSHNIPSGICVGGTRNGQACIPETVLKQETRKKDVPASGSTPATTKDVASENVNVAHTCGDPDAGGRCEPVSKIELVRGIFGQCLERDLTRNLGDSRDDHPCLTWNPTPILFGEKDVYHYQPTAGYFPPEGAGQYYCTTRARKPVKVRLSAGHFQGPQYAGNMTKFDYDDEYVSDEHKSEASIDGWSTDGSPTASSCEEADDDQDDDGPFEADTGALRLVTTGRSEDHSYTETFFALNPIQVARTIYAKEATAGTAINVTSDQVRSTIADTGIGYISILPFANPNGRGRLACGYQAEWVDAMPNVNYDDQDSSAQGDKQWRDQFFAEYDGKLSRSSEKLFSNAQDHPFAVSCVPLPGTESAGTSPAWTSCYLKTWEIGYRDAGQNKFYGLFADLLGTEIGSNLNSLKAGPKFNKCASDKPYFAIRAVFQTNADPTHQGRSASNITSSNIVGPWRLAGFWVSTCGGKSSDHRYIYMNVDIVSADVCRELAEVRSKDSEQDAAFTDRVHQSSGFSVPGLGIQYGVRNAPFSSAINTGPAGKDPLFQSNAVGAGLSPLKPPTFLAPGSETYFRAINYPKDKWAYLSNLFARIYRIYRYHEQLVTKKDKACLDGPYKGTRCEPDASPSPKSKTCSLMNFSCDTGAIHKSELSMFKFCDTSSGINTGLPCGNDPDICHLGAANLDRNTGALIPVLNRCIIGSSFWSVNPEGLYVDSRAPSNPPKTTQQAASSGAFKCEPGTIDRQVVARWGNPFINYGYRGGEPTCSQPTTQGSRECPRLVIGSCSAAGFCNNKPDQKCRTLKNANVDGVSFNADCSFTAQNYYLYRGEDNQQYASPLSLYNSVDVSPEGNTKEYRLSHRQERGERINVEGTLFPGFGDWIHTVDSATYKLSSCISLAESYMGPTVSTAQVFADAVTRAGASIYTSEFGRCQGGLRNGNLCMRDAPPDSTYSCAINPSTPIIAPNSSGVMTEMRMDAYEELVNRCGPVSDPPNAAPYTPVTECRAQGSDRSAAPNTSDDPDADNNVCTHGAGYFPRMDICSDPNDEFCGLISYKINETTARGSLDSTTIYPLPTDVTPGLYTPDFLGFRQTGASPDYSYAAYYQPIPPRLAAPDTRTCQSAGSCPLQKLDAFSFNNATEGIINVLGGQHQSTLRFYGWASHEQMPLRQVFVDWGDNVRQELPDAKIRNHKPYCQVQKECNDSIRGAGVTCNTDADCPSGSGRCMPLGTCGKRPHVICRTDQDCNPAGVTRQDVCNVRTFFGNNADACETSYFEFQHVYTCQGQGSATGLPSCAVSGSQYRCSRNPAKTCQPNTVGGSSDCAPGDSCMLGLAQPGGCWDQGSNACRYTPRVLLVDNWGWCTGECRDTVSGTDTLVDAPNAQVRHKYGGCYSGKSHLSNKLDVMTNKGTGETVVLITPAESTRLRTRALSNSSYSECNLDAPTTDRLNYRPWIVFPGSINVRTSGEAQQR